MPSVNEWIARYASGRSFADVGGLWNTKNERISSAFRAGATRLAMIDMQPLGNHWWTQFDERCRELGVSGYESISGNIEDPKLLDVVGRFDFVHCSGVIYHIPNPMLTLFRL